MTTRTINYTDTPGKTFYAYPGYTSATYSLANWTTHRVLLAESSAPNTGRYSGSVDDAKGLLWYVFEGAAQPSNWSEAVAVVDFTMEQIKDKTGLIGTGLAATGGAPVSDAGNLSEIIIGDDYSTDNGNEFAWTVTLPTGATIAGASCFFGGEHSDPLLADANSWLVDGVVSEGPTASQAVITFSLLKADTADLVAGDYNWSAEIRNDTGLESTRVRSKKTRRVALVEKYT